MRRLFLLVVACSSLVGCWEGGSEQTQATSTRPETGETDTGTQTSTEPTAQPVALVPMRAQALRRCRRFPELAEACPRLVPEGRFGPGSDAYEVFSRRLFPDPARIFSLQEGGEHPGQPELDRPPATVHVVVTAVPPFRTPLPRRARLRDGLLAERGRTPLFLGRRNWGGHEGVLVLVPPAPRGGLQANHLIFTWGGGSKSVSIHGWEPFTEVPGVLRVVVESIPAE
jgi:hypothetical protein